MGGVARPRARILNGPPILPESILKNGLDRLPLLVCLDDQASTPVDHENVRGADYYQ